MWTNLFMVAGALIAGAAIVFLCEFAKNSPRGLGIPHYLAEEAARHIEEAQWRGAIQAGRRDAEPSDGTDKGDVATAQPLFGWWA